MQVAPSDSGQVEMFADDHSLPDAAGGEPVFWRTSAAEGVPEDDFIQPDAPGGRD